MGVKILVTIMRTFRGKLKAYLSEQFVTRSKRDRHEQINSI